MPDTLFAAFHRTLDAERAAGALLDHGISPQSLSLCLSGEARSREHHAEDPEMQYTQSSIMVGDSDGMTRGVDVFHDNVSGPVSPPNFGPAYGENEIKDRPEMLGHGRGEDHPRPTYDPNSAAKRGVTTTTSGDATDGAEKGAGIGLGVGALAAIASLMMPGVGIVLGGGALATALAGLAGSVGGGAVAGGMLGFLVDQGVPHHDADKLAHSLDGQGTGALLAIELPNHFHDDEILGILEKYGAQTVSKHPIAQ